MILISTFFGCRLVWGSYASFSVFRDIFAARSLSGLPKASPSVAGIVYSSPTSLAGAMRAMQAGDMLSFARIGGRGTKTTAGAVPLWLAGAYLSANLTLNALNWYWFSRMIETVRKRFRQAPEEALAEAKKEDQEPVTANGARKPNGPSRARGKSAADGHADAASSGADPSNALGHARRRSRADSSLVLEQMAEAAELVRRRVVDGEIAPAEEGDELEAQ
jgi:TLC domain